MTRRTRIGSAVAVAAAAGFAIDRYVANRMHRAIASVPYGQLPCDRSYRVDASDGTTLYVEEVGRPDAPLTVIFAHGFMLELATWHFQRLALTSDDARLVFYDARCHGRSSSCGADELSVSQLGRDLVAVLENSAPIGPVVLVGHSMGGIAVQALVEDRPDLLRDRVAGVALISTSAGELDAVTFGLPRSLVRPLRRVLPPLAASVPDVVEAARRTGAGVRYVLTDLYSFGSRADPALVSFMDRMLSGVPMSVVTAFWPIFFEHAKADALPRLVGIPTLVLVGDADRIIPPEHSATIARLVPDAEYVVLPDAGHMAILERPDAVVDHLRLLIERASRRTTA